ncbi:ABC transporter permease [Halofilum ochraceum]|uniref:ABC transporter permease n=1 Tax=Halofilum ochraceum TaxID=1611323 RepID=UPI00082F1F28|nr:ABC transporter permease [Halofilum ochraceum]
MAQNESATPAADEVMRAADGTPLKDSLRRSMRRAKTKALLLVAPLGLFILFSFALPIADMVKRSFYSPEISNVLPETAELLGDWDGEGLPPEEIYAAFAKELAQADEDRNVGVVSQRVNYVMPGARSLFSGTARKLGDVESGPYKPKLIEIDEDWGDPQVWSILKREAYPITMSYFLSAVDMRYNAEGEIEAVASYMQIYQQLFWRTLWMSVLITVLTIALGFPVSYLLANLPVRTSNLLMILVLLPFWTSLLVRTSSWIVILQSEGVLNDLLVFFGIVAQDNRPQMIYNKIGTIVGMTHILLPFMILPLYSVMKGIPPSYLRAARSLGANPVVAFIRVYVPQTIPGIGAGSILVFILSIGYYITPALIGGSSGQLISNFIAYHMQQSLNWHLAAALGSILLFVVLGLYYIYNKLVGADALKLG